MITKNVYHRFVLNPERPQLPKNLRDQGRVEALMKKYFSSRNPKFRSILHGDGHINNTTISPKNEVALSTGSCLVVVLASTMLHILLMGL